MRMTKAALPPPLEHHRVTGERMGGDYPPLKIYGHLETFELVGLQDADYIIAVMGKGRLICICGPYSRDRWVDEVDRFARAGFERDCGMVAKQITWPQLQAELVRCHVNGEAR